VNLHGPSLGIGAGIAAVAIFVTFLAFDNITDEKELVLEQAKNGNCSYSSSNSK